MMHKSLFKKPWFLGICIGFLAALIQILFANLGGPEAYGFCVACHIRDLVNGSINKIFGRTIVAVAPISSNAIFPTLSIVGVILGAFLASILNKEFKFKKSSWISYLLYFIAGVFVLCFALFVGGCPYRLALRTGYGDLIALIGIISLFFGVSVGVLIIVLRMKKKEGGHI